MFDLKEETWLAECDYRLTPLCQTIDINRQTARVIRFRIRDENKEKFSRLEYLIMWAASTYPRFTERFRVLLVESDLVEETITEKEDPDPHLATVYKLTPITVLHLLIEPDEQHNWAWKKMAKEGNVETQLMYREHALAKEYSQKLSDIMYTRALTKRTKH